VRTTWGRRTRQKEHTHNEREKIKKKREKVATYKAKAVARRKKEHHQCVCIRRLERLCDDDLSDDEIDELCVVCLF